VTGWPLHTASHSAEEAVFRPQKNKNQQLKAALPTTKAMWVMERGGGMEVLGGQLTGLM